MTTKSEASSRSLEVASVQEKGESETPEAPVPSEPPNTEQQLPAPETNSTLLLRCYPHWRGRPIYHGNQEALGWSLDAIGRAVAFIAAGAFLAPALLRLAKEAAGCETEPPPGSNQVPDCDKRVYGFRPSSLLTTYTIVIGIVSAILLPFMGAVVDYTPYRLQVGRWTSVCLCIMLFPQIFLNSKTWFPLAILLVFVAFLGWAQTVVTYAYLPELADTEERLSQYTQSFTILSFGSMVIYLAVVAGIAEIAGMSDNHTAQLGMAVAFGVGSLTLYVAWFHLMKPRPAAHELPNCQSLWTAGFCQVYHTSIRIYKTLPALKWFYISVALIDAAVNSLATVAITYLTDTLNFSSQENVIAFLCMLLASIPGGVLAGKTTRLMNQIRSSIVATLILMLNTVAAAIVLKGPGQQLETYFLAVGWGLGTGWKWTIDRLLASTIIPIGQDAELMGVYLFAGQILTWLPPLIFTALNEAGVSQRVGIGTLAIWFLAGIVALALIGSYREAVTAAGRSRILRRTDNQAGDPDLLRDGNSSHTGQPVVCVQNEVNAEGTDADRRLTHGCTKHKDIVKSNQETEDGD